jgi:hypothetical protein
MNKISPFLLFYFVLLQNITNAEIVRELGGFIGTSYYNGEINPVKQFYDPSPAFGALFKLNFNSRQVLRFHAIYGQFRGNDLDFNNDWQQNRAVSFSASLVDVNACYEFNFLPYRYHERWHSFSPYLFAGLGYEFMIATKYNIGNHVSVPFGTGIKYLASKKITLGVEWGFRKTFQDNIDGITNPGNATNKSAINNNDWYSFAGFFITFRLFDHSGECPAYW